MMYLSFPKKRFPKKRVNKSPVCFYIILSLCWMWQGCAPPILQTKEYTWKNELPSFEKKIDKDWYVLSKEPKKAKEEREQLGWCADKQLRTIHKQLSQLTKQCYKISGVVFKAAALDRGMYYAALSVGILGGTAVLAAPAVSLFAEKTPENQTTSLVLTVSGAAAISISSLWIRSLGVGESSNTGFKKATKLAKLIQGAEVEWLASVCKAPSLKVAQENAAGILKQMAKQCVPKISNVQINPDISSIVQKEQKSTQSIISRYQSLQRSVDAQRTLEDSDRLLKKYSKDIDAAYAQLLGSPSKERAQRLVALEVMCEKARAEHKRNQQLRAQLYQKSSESKIAPGGSWAGVCSPTSLQKLGGLSNRVQQQTTLTKSEERLKKLIQQIYVMKNSKPLKIVTKAGPDKLKELCLQADEAHKRVLAIRRSLPGSGNANLPPGAWYGICRSRYPKDFSSNKKEGSK